MRCDLVIIRTDRLEALRRTEALTVEELAARAGIHSATLRRLRRGDAAGLPTAKKLARALRVEANALIQGWVEPHGEVA